MFVPNGHARFTGELQKRISPPTRVSIPLLMRLGEENVFFSRHKGNCCADSKTPSEAGQRVTCVIFVIMSAGVRMESGLYWPPPAGPDIWGVPGQLPAPVTYLAAWIRCRKRIAAP